MLKTLRLLSGCEAFCCFVWGFKGVFNDSVSDFGSVFEEHFQDTIIGT